MPCPLIGSVSSTGGDSVVEKIFVHRIFVVRISLLFKQIVICKQGYFKNAKAYVCLEILKNAFFVKASEFCKDMMSTRYFTVSLKESGYLS